MFALGVWITVDAARAASTGYEPPRNFTELVAAVAAVAALIVALGVIARATVRAYRAVRRALDWVESIHELTQRELDGSASDGTIVEELHGVAISVGQLQRRADQLTAQVGLNSRRISHVEADLRAIYDPHNRHKHNPTGEGEGDI